MIVAFSTSSPVTSVALLSESGEVIASGSKEAPRGASGACLQILKELLVQSGRSLSQVTLFASDIGPGSFTGVKVGVTLAKTLAFAHRVPVVGRDSFDLINPSDVVFLPSKRNEWFVRVPGQPPIRTESLPQEAVLGYGAEDRNQTFPSARLFGGAVGSLIPMAPELFVPSYLIEPSISISKTPFTSMEKPIESN